MQRPLAALCLLVVSLSSPALATQSDDAPIPEQVVAVALRALRGSPQSYDGREVVIDAACLNRIPRRDQGFLCLDVEMKQADSFAGVYLTDRKLNFVASDELARGIQGQLKSAYERNARIHATIHRVHIGRIPYWVAAVTRIEGVDADGSVRWSASGPTVDMSAADAVAPLPAEEPDPVVPSEPVQIDVSRPDVVRPDDTGDVPTFSADGSGPQD